MLRARVSTSSSLFFTRSAAVSATTTSLCVTSFARASSSSSAGKAAPATPADEGVTLNEYTLDQQHQAFVHPRSKFEYEGSKKADEVGARNEAAFIPYQQTHPDWASDPKAAWGLPHFINLLTVAPLSVAMSVAAAVFWGIALWRLYASKHFRSVKIERPPIRAH